MQLSKKSQVTTEYLWTKGVQLQNGCTITSTTVKVDSKVLFTQPSLKMRSQYYLRISNVLVPAALYFVHFYTLLGVLGFEHI